MSTHDGTSIMRPARSFQEQHLSFCVQFFYRKDVCNRLEKSEKSLGTEDTKIYSNTL